MVEALDVLDGVDNRLEVLVLAVAVDGVVDHDAVDVVVLVGLAGVRS